MDGLYPNQTSCNPPILQTAEDLNSILFANVALNSITVWSKMSLQRDNLMMTMPKCWAAQSNNLWLNHNHSTGNHWLIMETSYSVWSSVLFQDVMRNGHK